MSATFQFNPTLPPPVFSRPKHITTYSSHPPKYYNPHIQSRDLNVGYETHIPKQLNACISPLLDAVKEIQFKNIQFVAFRGVIAKLMRTPFEKEAYTLHVTKRKGVVYIQENLDGRKEDQSDERMKRMSYWGYKFEDLVTLNKPAYSYTDDEMQTEIAAKDHIPIDTNAEFAVVSQINIGGIRCVIGAEVDCIDEDGNYVELKTSRKIETQRQSENFERYKLLKYWSQSYLIAIPTIYVGWRSDDGVILDVSSIDVLSIPGRVRNSVAAWEGSGCLQYLYQVLDWLYRQVTEGDHTSLHYDGLSTALNRSHSNWAKFRTLNQS